MIEKHYAGIIENWDGKQIPAERQNPAARQLLQRPTYVGPVTSDFATAEGIPCKSGQARRGRRTPLTPSLQVNVGAAP